MTSVTNREEKTGSGVNTYLLVPIFLFFVLLIFAVIRSPSLISPAGIGSAIIVVAPLVLATYALTVIVMAGRGSVDLSIGPLLGFINVCLIQLTGFGALQSPIAVFLFVMGAGMAYQLLMALIVVFVRVQPIIVSLSGFLSLVGLNLVILPRPGGLAPDWMLSWGAGTTVFSPVLVILILATAGWYILARTSFWGHLKLMGSDERAAYTSGIQINIVRIGAHMIGGVFAGLAALTYTALISSGDPTQGTTYTLMAVTALVLGGANLAGGRGGAFGSLLGAFNIYLVTYVLATFNFGTLQSFVTDLAFGLMLVFSLIVSLFVPELQRRIRGLSPTIFFAIMSIPALGVIINRTIDQPIKEEGSSFTFTTFEMATTGVEQEATGAAGSIFIIAVIGLVALIAFAKLLIQMRNLSAVGLAGVVFALGFGMLFNPSTEAESASELTYQEPTSKFFSLEAASGFTNSPTTDIMFSGFAGSVIWVVVAILLTSFIVIVALPNFSVRMKKISLWWFALGISLVVILAILFPNGSALSGLLSDLKDYHVALFVGVLLFLLSGPLVQAPIKDISQMFIIALSVISVCGFMFFSPANDMTNTEFDAQFAAPVLDVKKTEFQPIETYPKPKRVVVEFDYSFSSLLTQISFSLILIVLAQYFVGRAMGPTSFQNFWPYAPVTVMCLLAGGAALFVMGVSIWKLLSVLTIGVLTAPIVLHILKTYRARQVSDRRGVSNKFATYQDPIKDKAV